MSFILDALKKSESDRQRQSGPSLFEVKVAPPRRALPIWAVAIGVLLLVNIVVISWMLLRHPAERQPPSAAVPAESTSASSPANRASAQDTVAAHQAAPSSLPGPAAPGAMANSGSQPAATAPSGIAAPATNGGPSSTAGATATASPSGSGSPSAAVRSESSSASAAARSPATVAQAPGATASGDPSDYAPAVEPSAAHGSGAGGVAGDDLPLYQQVSGSAGLPDLHLDLHVFAARPQDRFVMINMHRLGEGGSLPNGVQVEAIRPDGVVLSYHGTRFLLPRS